jgi:type III restriction enzyme
MVPHPQGASAGPERPTIMTVVIENPVLNSPFAEPRRHFRFAEDGITDEVVEGHRPSSYFIPIAAPKKKGKQLTFETQRTQDRVKDNDNINFINHYGDEVLKVYPVPR